MSERPTPAAGAIIDVQLFEGGQPVWRSARVSVVVRPTSESELLCRALGGKPAPGGVLYVKVDKLERLVAFSIQGPFWRWPPGFGSSSPTPAELDEAEIMARRALCVSPHCPETSDCHRLGYCMWGPPCQ